MFGFGGPKLDETLFQLRFCEKQLQRHARHAEKDMNTQKAKVKKELQKGNVEAARIYAENAVRKKNESLNYLRMAGKVDAVQARVQSAATMQSVAKNIGVTTKALEAALSSMNLEKVQTIMDKFETSFENLDVHSSVMEGSMSSATATSAPSEAIDALMKQVADENGLEISAALPEVGQETIVKEKGEEDLLTRRLAALRDGE